MLTLEQIDLVIREYHIVNILLFIMGWMMYDLYKLYKSNKPSERQLDIAKYNIQKANEIISKKKSNYISIDNLKKENNSLLKTIQSKNIVIDLKNQSINTFRCENEYLKEKIDNLVEELMKRQSYDNIEKPKFFQESTYPLVTYTNHKDEQDDKIEDFKEFIKTQNYTGMKQ